MVGIPVLWNLGVGQRKMVLGLRTGWPGLCSRTLSQEENNELNKQTEGIIGILNQ